jgi:hypothetical protein
LSSNETAGVASPARKDTPMLRVVTDDGRSEMRVELDEIVREGARRMLAAALEAEAAAYVERSPTSWMREVTGW